MTEKRVTTIEKEVPSAAESTKETWQYWYRAIVDHNHDGDTVTLTTDMGRRVMIGPEPIRFYRINCPELSQPGGAEARDYVKSVLKHGDIISIRTYLDRDDKFGRLLADVYVKDEHGETYCLNDALVKTGHAVYKDY